MEMLFSPCNALIRKLLLDAVWFMLELVEATLDGAVKFRPFRQKNSPRRRVKFSCRLQGPSRQIALRLRRSIPRETRDKYVVYAI